MVTGIVGAGWVWLAVWLTITVLVVTEWDAAVTRHDRNHWNRRRGGV